MNRLIILAAALLSVAPPPAAAQFGKQPAPFDPTPQTRLVDVSSEPALAAYDAESITAFQAQRRQQLARNEDGTFWEFADPKPYHQAAVRVETGTAGGSGVLVGTTGSFILCVTNHHVVDQGGGSVSQTVRLHLRDGQTVKAEHLQSTPREDVAVYRVDRTDLPCIAISSENAPDDEPIEVMGFGGPLHSKNAFRPYVAKPVPTTKALAIDAPAISGDSGAGMIWNGLLVGVNWGADERTKQWAVVDGGDDVGLVYPATSSADAKFLNRFLTQACGPYQCQPLIGNRPGLFGGRLRPQQQQPPQQFPGPEQLYPPQGGQQAPPQQQPPSGGLTPPNVPEQQPPTPQPPSQQPSQPDLQPPANGPACDCDDERLLAALEKLQTPGPEGPKGEQGERGPVGPQAEITQAQLNAIKAEIYAQIQLDPSMKGPKGEAGKDAEVDLDELAQMVADRLPPISLALMGPDGEELDKDTARIGGTLKLQFVPRKD